MMVVALVAFTCTLHLPWKEARPLQQHSSSIALISDQTSQSSPGGQILSLPITRQKIHFATYPRNNPSHEIFLRWEEISHFKAWTFWQWNHFLFSSRCLVLWQLVFTLNAQILNGIEHSPLYLPCTDHSVCFCRTLTRENCSCVVNLYLSSGLSIHKGGNITGTSRCWLLYVHIVVNTGVKSSPEELDFHRTPSIDFNPFSYPFVQNGAKTFSLFCTTKTNVAHET